MFGFRQNNREDFQFLNAIFQSVIMGCQLDTFGALISTSSKTSSEDKANEKNDEEGIGDDSTNA